MQILIHMIKPLDSKNELLSYKNLFQNIQVFTLIIHRSHQFIHNKRQKRQKKQNPTNELILRYTILHNNYTILQNNYTILQNNYTILQNNYTILLHKRALEPGILVL